jgi:hypothetical protein
MWWCNGFQQRVLWILFILWAGNRNDVIDVNSIIFETHIPNPFIFFFYSRCLRKKSYGHKFELYKILITNSSISTQTLCYKWCGGITWKCIQVASQSS